jgi:hypothetical protein
MILSRKTEEAARSPIVDHCSGKRGSNDIRPAQATA